MTDQRDPYADRPYVPPTQRDQAPPAEAASGWPFSEPRAHAFAAADQEPTVTMPEPVTEPTVAMPEPVTEPTVAMPEPEPTIAWPGSAGGLPPQPPHQPAPRRRRRAGRLVAAATGIVLLSGASAAGGAALYSAMNEDGSTTTTTTTGTSLDRQVSSNQAVSDVTAVADAVLPSTVMINVVGRGESGTGTGIVISEDGDILTNNHVIEAAADGGSITVAFSDGTNASARILGRDVATDVAVIKAENVSGLPAATLGDSQQVRVGQSVVAIGSPFGLEATVTQGIVSALNRPVSPGDGSRTVGRPTTTFPAIQTDAAINPGNSGGPLVDMEGHVIGINSAINTGGSGTGSVGLGFAIPINLASSVASQILEGKTVEHARIGVVVRDARGDDQLTTIGAEVGEVEPGSAAAEAGLEAGDIVTKVDGNPISTNDALVATVRGYRPGDEITLTVLRDDETLEVELTLGSDGGSTARAQQ